MVYAGLLRYRPAAKYGSRNSGAYNPDKTYNYEIG